MRVLRNVVTQAAVMNEFKHLRGVDGFDIDDLWRHSIATGQMCSTLARRCKTPLELTPDEFYVCGLLHDLGQIVMLDSLGDEYVNVIRQSKRENLPIQKAEERAFQFNHTDVGFVVATRWSLPDAVARAIQYHHGPREAVESDPVVSLVANANLLVNRVATISKMSANLVFDEDTCQQLGLEIDDMEEVVELTRQSLVGAEV
jgi:putative nucleotidyltransferase with HDIG domain